MNYFTIRVIFCEILHLNLDVELQTSDVNCGILTEIEIEIRSFATPFWVYLFEVMHG